MKGFYNTVRLKRDFIRFVTDNSRVIILYLLLVTGVLFGALFVRNGWFSSFLDVSSLFDSFIASRGDKSFIKAFFSSYSSNLVFLAAVFLSGVMLTGAPFVFALPLIRGLGYGWMCGYIYSVYGLKGVAFSMLLILPNAFTSCSVLVFASDKSADFSLMLFGLVSKPQVCRDYRAAFSRLCSKFLKYLLILLFSSLIDALISCVFIGVFGL